MNEAQRNKLKENTKKKKKREVKRNNETNLLRNVQKQSRESLERVIFEEVIVEI